MDGGVATGAPLSQTRIDHNFIIPHTKHVNPSIYKYHDFVRTRQQLQL